MLVIPPFKKWKVQVGGREFYQVWRYLSTLARWGTSLSSLLTMECVIYWSQSQSGRHVTDSSCLYYLEISLLPWKVIAAISSFPLFSNWVSVVRCSYEERVSWLGSGVSPHIRRFQFAFERSWNGSIVNCQLSSCALAFTDSSTQIQKVSFFLIIL